MLVRIKCGFDPLKEDVESSGEEMTIQIDELDVDFLMGQESLALNLLKLKRFSASTFKAKVLKQFDNMYVKLMEEANHTRRFYLRTFKWDLRNEQV